MPNQANIFLTGFMGSGKTSLGKKLAQVLRRTFIDLDQYIEKKMALSIPVIFNQFGEDEFRRIEKECLEELIQTNNLAVIALGGGTICFFDNLQEIKKNGLLIYLQLPPKVLAERIKKSKTVRPLLQKLKSDELLLTIENKLNSRLQYYEQAQLCVNGLNLTPQILQHNIIEYQQKNNS